MRGPGGNLSLPLDMNLNVDIQALIWTGIGSYTVAWSPAGTLDLFGGARYLGLETSTDLSFSGPEGSRTLGQPLRPDQRLGRDRRRARRSTD